MTDVDFRPKYADIETCSGQWNTKGLFTLGLPTPHVFDTARNIIINRWPPYSSYIKGTEPDD